MAIRGKIAFGEGRYDDAEKDLAECISRSSEDSSVFYLYGLLQSRAGNREAAADNFNRATDLEPEYYLYWFRRAENEHLLGRDPVEAVQRALELAPDDIWVLNLAGLIHLERKRDPQALELLSKAYGRIPEDETEEDDAYAEIIANYTEALYRTGDGEQALALLMPYKTNTHLLNQMGNILSHRHDYESASAVYERALLLAPNDHTLRMNCAAACIEADRVLRAEEILSRILDEGEDSAAYNLMGNAALIKGDHLRAEAAYIRALEIDPQNQDAAMNLADLQVNRRMFSEAGDIILRFLPQSEHPRVVALKEVVRNETELEIFCHACGRKWVTLKDPGEQPRLRIEGELPDESPAGKCPKCETVYCIGCAKPTLDGGRFHCLECGKPLKLAGNHLKHIVSGFLP